MTNHQPELWQILDALSAERDLLRQMDELRWKLPEGSPYRELLEGLLGRYEHQLDEAISDLEASVADQQGEVVRMGGTQGSAEGTGRRRTTVR